MTLEITGEQFDELLSKKEVVVANFSAAWCGPCKMLAPIMELVNENNDDNTVGIAKMSIDTESDTASRFGIKSIPTIIYFKNGEAVSRTVGYQTQETIEETISKLK